MTVADGAKKVSISLLKGKLYEHFNIFDIFLIFQKNFTVLVRDSQNADIVKKWDIYAYSLLIERTNKNLRFLKFRFSTLGLVVYRY